MPLSLSAYSLFLRALTSDGQSGGAAECYPPETSSGTLLFVVVPVPSWPYRLSPQQSAAPPVVSPHVWLAPRLSAAKLNPPETGTGTLLFVVVPSPSSPRTLSPQQ